MGSVLLYFVGILGGALAVTQGASNVALKRSLGGSVPPLWFSYLSGAAVVAIYSVVRRGALVGLDRRSIRRGVRDGSTHARRQIGSVHDDGPVARGPDCFFYNSG